MWTQFLGQQIDYILFLFGFALTILAVISLVYYVIRRRRWTSLQLVLQNGRRLTEAQAIAHLGNWTLDARTGRYTWSQEAGRILGCRQEQEGASGDVFWRYVEDRDRSKLELKLRSALEAEEAFEQEISVLRPDGGNRNIVCKAEAIVDAVGKVVQLVGTAQDITERVQMEDRIRASEAVLSSAMDIAMMAPWEYDVAAGTFIFNARLYAILGTTAQREGGYTMTLKAFISEFVPADDAVTVTGAFQEAFGYHGQAYSRHLEHRVIGRDGQERHVAVDYLTEKDALGTTARIYGTIQDITARKMAEISFHQSEKRMAEVTEFIPDAIMAVDRNGVILAWNRAMERLTGVKAADMLGKGDHEYALPFYGERRLLLLDYVMNADQDLPQDYSSIRRQDDVTSAEVCVWHLRGSKALLHVTSTVLRNLKGEVVGAIESIRDITERKLMEESIRVSERQLSDAVEMAGLAYWECDLVAGVFTFNSRFYALLGTTAEREGGFLMPADVYAAEFLPTEDAHIVADEIRRAMESRDPDNARQLDHSIIRRDGRLRHISVRFSIVRDASGRAIKSIGVNQDITERKQAEEAVYEAQQVFRTLVENSPDIIARYDRDCRRTYVNPTYLKVAQMPHEELLATAPVQYSPLPPASAEVLQNLLRKVLDSGVAEAVDVMWPKSDNIEHWYNVFAFPEFDREGRVVSVMTISRDITERKGAQEALHAAKDYAENLIETANAIVVGLDNDGNLTVFNKTAEIVTGYTRQELAGRNWFEVLVPRDRYPGVWEEFERLKAGRMPDKFENPILTKGGQERYIIWQNNVVQEHGRDVGTISFGIDVTAGKQAEEALRLSEERLRLAAEGAKLGTYTYDFATGKGYWSPELKALYGLKADEPLELDSDGVTLAMHPDDRAAFLAAMKAANDPHGKVDGVLQLEYRIIHTDGSTRWLRVHGYTEFIGEGQDRRPWRAAGATFDITDERKAEESLRASEEQLRAMFETAAIGMAQADPSTGRFLRVNRKLCDITGYSPEELTGGMRFPDITHPDDRRQDWEAFERMVRGEQPEYHLEKRYIRKNGSSVWVNVNVTVLRNADGQPICSIAAIANISKRKAAEEKLQRQHDLVSRIAETSPVGIVATDKDGNIVFANASAEEILMLTRDLLIGRSYNAPEWRITDYDGNQFPDKELPFARVSATCRPVYNVCHAVERSDGQRALLSINAAPLCNAEGQFYGMVAAIEDVTDRKRTEQKLLELIKKTQDRIA